MSDKQDEKPEEKVVSLHAKREKKAAEPEKKAETLEEGYDFEAEMVKNKKEKERLEKERLSANKGVLRSYRIKT